MWQPKSVVVEELLGRQLGGQLAGGFQSHPDFVLADEDRVVVQTRGPSTTKQGATYNNTYCLIFTIRDGEWTEVIEHCDTSLVDRVLDPPSTDTVGWSRLD